MITVRILGGLGNQLFQVTAAEYLRSVRSLAARCDLSWYSRPRDGITFHDLGVEPLLRGRERIRVPGHLDALVYSRRNPWLVRESGPHDELADRLPPHAWVEGYFQQARLPLAVRGWLRDRLLPALDQVAIPEATHGTIGVHVRLGDYLYRQSTRDFHGVSAPSYFRDALEIVRDKMPDAPVVLFTDSPEAIARLYGDTFGPDVVVSQTTTAWQTLHAMSQCSAFVMSNSSLSWWGAFIATQLRGRSIPVIKPTPWFATASSADSLLGVDDWLELPRER